MNEPFDQPTPAEPGPGEPLSQQLRSGTQQAHERAEQARFVGHLLNGDLPLAAYTDLVVQNHTIYRQLEVVGRALRDHPQVGPLIQEELLRTAHLEADLRALLGPEWADQAAQRVVPATARYAQRLSALPELGPAAFVAHHYVRYLGDLSGGQVIGSRIQRIYGPAGAQATAFYRFDGIPRIKPFRDRYRDLLDRAGFTPDQQRVVVEEADRAFGFNLDVFIDLADRHLPPVDQAGDAA